MRDLLDFKTKEDRNDFFIAIAVIGLFIAFFSWMLGCEENSIAPKDVQAAVAPIAMVDTDKDGVPDESDDCPKIAGVLVNGGCPADTDKDGVPDGEDKCPQVAGIITNAGCPSDRDKDGVADDKDACPELMGILANNGCPADGDGDGVYDINDKCPEKAGLAENGGCPEVRLEEAEKSILLNAMQNIAFQTGSATLKGSSVAILNQVLAIMKKYPNYKIDINGHTDNAGNAQDNLVLSQNRAKACYTYLLNKGIANNRMSYKGFGARKPIATNDTPDGKRQNRRVEFNLHY